MAEEHRQGVKSLLTLLGCRRKQGLSSGEGEMQSLEEVKILLEPWE